jgi:hypothetical protein
MEGCTNLLKTSLLVLTMMSLCCCASVATLYVSGDAKAIGAQIYVDGKQAGVMEKIIYRGVTSNDPVVAEREKKLQKQLGIGPGDLFSSAQVNVTRGKHHIVFVSKAGDRLEKDFSIDFENYVRIQFSDLTIQGGD